jgi:hypothetical protein
LPFTVLWIYTVPVDVCIPYPAIYTLVNIWMEEHISVEAAEGKTAQSDAWNGIHGMVLNT